MLEKVTILILIDGFLQYYTYKSEAENSIDVTILILIDGFLQFGAYKKKMYGEECHNPYFNRWFSAIWVTVGQQKREAMSQSLF